MNHMLVIGKRAAVVCVLLSAWLSLAFTLLSGDVMAGQNSPLNEPEAYEIKLDKDPRGGKVAYISGIATPEGENLKLVDLWSTQAVKLLVMPEDENQNIEVELRKFHWTEPLRSVSSANSGKCGFVFTNQGDVFIKISAPEGPATVYLSVMVTDDPNLEMAPVFIPKGEKP